MTIANGIGYSTFCLHCYVTDSIEHYESALAEDVYRNGSPNYPGAAGSASASLRYLLDPAIIWRLCAKHRRALAEARRQKDEAFAARHRFDLEVDK